jgi:hypothetical protein
VRPRSPRGPAGLWKVGLESTARRLDWAALLPREFQSDLLRCDCGCRREVIAFIPSGRSARQILEKLGVELDRRTGFSRVGRQVGVPVPSPSKVTRCRNHCGGAACGAPAGAARQGRTILPSSSDLEIPAGFSRLCKRSRVPSGPGGCTRHATAWGRRVTLGRAGPCPLARRSPCRRPPLRAAHLQPADSGPLFPPGAPPSSGRMLGGQERAAQQRRVCVEHRGPRLVGCLPSRGPSAKKIRSPGEETTGADPRGPVRIRMPARWRSGPASPISFTGCRDSRRDSSTVSSARHRSRSSRRGEARRPLSPRLTAQAYAQLYIDVVQYGRCYGGSLAVQRKARLSNRCRGAISADSRRRASFARLCARTGAFSRAAAGCLRRVRSSARSSSRATSDERLADYPLRVARSGVLRDAPRGARKARARHPSRTRGSTCPPRAEDHRGHRRAEGAALAVEAGRTVVLEATEVARWADSAGMAVVAS